MKLGFDTVSAEMLTNSEFQHSALYGFREFNCCAQCLTRPVTVAARGVHMACGTDVYHMQSHTHLSCCGMGIAPASVHVADSHVAGWSRSAAVTFRLS